MARVKRGFVAQRRRKKILDRTEGFIGSSSTLFRTANERYIKALRNATRDRKTKKREYRSLWIARLNAAANENGMNYSQFISVCKEEKILLNRKVLSQLAIHDRQAFHQLIETIQ